MNNTKVELSMDDLKELRSYLNLIILNLRGNKKVEWENLHSSVSSFIETNKKSIEVCMFDKIYTHYCAMRWQKTQNIK